MHRSLSLALTSKKHINTWEEVHPIRELQTMKDEIRLPEGEGAQKNGLVLIDYIVITSSVGN